MPTPRGTSALPRFLPRISLFVTVSPGILSSKENQTRLSYTKQINIWKCASKWKWTNEADGFGEHSLTTLPSSNCAPCSLFWNAFLTSHLPFLHFHLYCGLCLSACETALTNWIHLLHVNLVGNFWGLFIWLVSNTHIHSSPSIFSSLHLMTLHGSTLPLTSVAAPSSPSPALLQQNLQFGNFSDFLWDVLDIVLPVLTFYIHPCQLHLLLWPQLPLICGKFPIYFSSSDIFLLF